MGLKRLVELVQDNGGTLSLVLVGHPKLRNDLRRPALEEIGARTTLFWLDGIKGQEQVYLDWLLEQCAPADAADHLLTAEARERLAAALSTPLQIEQYLTLALEAAYQVGQKPVTLEGPSGLQDSLCMLHLCCSRSLQCPYQVVAPSQAQHSIRVGG